VDGEEQVVTQMGLLLTQVRYARLALENIERATSRYAGVALSVAGTGAAPLGSPPLIDGALKVYVVNINDLTAGGPGIGDVLAGVIGGAGRFLGGFFGGLVGGTVSGIAFPYLFWQIGRIVDTLERIVIRIGWTKGDEDKKEDAKKKEEGASLMAQLGSLAETLRLVAQVFRAAAPEGPVAPPPVTSSVHTYLDLVRSLSHVVNGLILLVPLLMGALASFLIRLDDIKLAIVDMLQFALRNVFLLRAAVIATVLDTLSLAGRLAGGVLGIVAGLVDTVLESVFRVIRVGLETVLAALRIASTGIKNTIDQLMLFLRDGVGALLIFLGDLRIFRLVFHLAEVLPLVLPALARVMGTPLSREETTALQAAAAIRPPSGGGTPTPVPIAAFPDLAATLLPPDAQADLVRRVDGLGRTIRDESRASFGAVQGALDGIGARMRETVGTLDEGLDRELTTRLATAQGHAQALADSMRAAEEVARTRPRTGLEAIASAYEGWLREGGLRTLMAGITEHFRTTPTDATAGGRTIPGRVITGIVEREGERSVMVEIGEVSIDLGEAPPASGDGLAPQNGFDPDSFLEWQQRIEDRRGLVPIPVHP
jgi:hypothetical protein